MGEWKDILTAVLIAIIGSSGIWALILRWIEKHDAKAEMLKGLGHDRILELGQSYIRRGNITADEFENLHDYLFVPYTKLKGNGTAEKTINDVKKLPLVDNTYNGGQS